MEKTIFSIVGRILQYQKHPNTPLAKVLGKYPLKGAIVSLIEEEKEVEEAIEGNVCYHRNET